MQVGVSGSESRNRGIDSKLIGPKIGIGIEESRNRGIDSKLHSAEFFFRHCSTFTYILLLFIILKTTLIKQGSSVPAAIESVLLRIVRSESRNRGIDSKLHFAEFFFRH